MLSLSMRVPATIAASLRPAAARILRGQGQRPSSSLIAASRFGTPSLRRMADTWLRTVVAETNRRSEISAVLAPLRISSSTSHSTPRQPRHVAVGHREPVLLPVTELRRKSCWPITNSSLA